MSNDRAITPDAEVPSPVSAQVSSAKREDELEAYVASVRRGASGGPRVWAVFEARIRERVAQRAEALVEKGHDAEHARAVALESLGSPEALARAQRRQFRRTFLKYAVASGAGFHSITEVQALLSGAGDPSMASRVFSVVFFGVFMGAFISYFGGSSSSTAGRVGRSDEQRARDTKASLGVAAFFLLALIPAAGEGWRPFLTQLGLTAVLLPMLWADLHALDLRGEMLVLKGPLAVLEVPWSRVTAVRDAKGWKAFGVFFDRITIEYVHDERLRKFRLQPRALGKDELLAAARAHGKLVGGSETDLFG